MRVKLPWGKVPWIAAHTALATFRRGCRKAAQYEPRKCHANADRRKQRTAAAGPATQHLSAPRYIRFSRLHPGAALKRVAVRLAIGLEHRSVLDADCIGSGSAPQCKREAVRSACPVEGIVT